MWTAWVWGRSMRTLSWLENTPCWETTTQQWSVIRGSWNRLKSTSTQWETPLYSRNGNRLEFHLLDIVLYQTCIAIHLTHNGMFMCWLCLGIQVWQEINEETKHVREIMTTLGSFQQQESTPSKPSSFSQENDIMPVHVEHRYVVRKYMFCFCQNGYTRVLPS